MAACCVFLGSILLAIILLIFFYPPDLPKVSLSSLTVTKFNSTGDHISGYLNMQFQVLNPNLVTDFFYHDVNCSVYHDKDHLASTMSPGFVHPARETRQISVTVHLTPGTTARGIGDDLATYDFTEFDVKLTILVKSLFRSSEFVEVSCDDVTVGLLPTIGGHGKMIGPARICQVS
ncbi:unnamed protein product [Arabidopsis lyrata]|uniref:Late embryogenesis abundant protein LEA-2 subgroup domain-containing protein n=1 Tax=Arabidopsis lyrata subsp. lyrata TaxID=81972 RepID=D7KQN0_ARALL|nr:hypothetical protein ARALYDRAFT_890071 [Arabidopsis lyrata subsp. lyrata]CAH8253494.1 unnamed protein product [Arabidopsis lyrata]